MLSYGQATIGSGRSSSSGTIDYGNRCPLQQPGRWRAIAERMPRARWCCNAFGVSTSMVRKGFGIAFPIIKVSLQVGRFCFGVLAFLAETLYLARRFCG